MTSSLKNTLRLKVQYPLRYAMDVALTRLRADSTVTCRILIASDNLVMTSEQQMAPLLAHRAYMRDEFGVVFDQRHIDDVLATERRESSRYNAVLAKLSFLTPAAEAIEKIARLRQLFPDPVKLIYFDGDDDCCVQWGGLVEIVDLYVKKHVFTDRSWYQRQFTGKNNLTDYVSRLADSSFTFADNIIPHSGTVSPELTKKIALGYNIGLDDKITQLFESTQPASESVKNVDVMCRAVCAPDLWIYPLRGPVKEALAPLAQKGYSVLLPDRRVDQQVYYDEMRRSRICVSPFGYGEICWRDFEAVLMGCLLVKPDMGHVSSEPDIFIAGETYVPVRPDFSDLSEVCARYLADTEARIRITTRAYDVLSDYYRSFAFAKRFLESLEQAHVEPFVGAESSKRVGELTDAL